MEQKNSRFYSQIYELVRQIPEGKVSTYGHIAKMLNKEGAARQIGYALSRAGSTHPPVPAHRVVNSKGVLSAKHAFAGPTLMQELLESEGLTIKDDKVVDFQKVIWRPTDDSIIP
ncbi:MGMT family protein [Olivibacter sitiensis]|uniref:MGMT family protein n=1 Tax=Olivibacter sitiensis TaxID=376470 RepID=UPI0004894ABF|nr:MGMT family protein [Olivibacter sitiensis]